MESVMNFYEAIIMLAGYKTVITNDVYDGMKIIVCNIYHKTYDEVDNLVSRYLRQSNDT